MFLQYASDVPSGRVVVMGNAAQHRVELFILSNHDERFSLVAAAGKDGERAAKLKLQGPYEQREQALAARAAIVQQLMQRHFECLSEVLSVWELTAQRAIRELRVTRNATQGDYSFRPEDVYFD